jgi:hypothetical protein
MSCYVESPEHIAAIVGTIERGNSTTFDEDRALVWARELARENVRSVNARYRERRRTYPIPTVDQIRAWFDKPLRPADLVMACRGLSYQSCEHDGWETSKARRYILAGVFDVATRIVAGSSEGSWSISAPPS